MNKIHNSVALYITALIIFLDGITKFFATKMTLGQTIPIIQDIFHFTLVHNNGAGFGILKGARIFFIVFSFIVLIVLALKWKKIPEKLNTTIPLGLILGGLLGNLYDRITLGFVIDFIDFRIWPVFNIADACITIGAIWLILYSWKK